MTRSKKLLPVVLFLLAGFTGCRPEELDTVGIKVDPVRPEYAIPLIQSDLTLDDLIGTGGIGFVKKQSDGFLSLVYRGTVLSTRAGTLVPISDQTFQHTFSLTDAQATALNNGQSQTIPLDASYTFSMGSKEIDSLWIKAGNLTAALSGMIKTGGVLKVTFQDAYQGSGKLSIQLPFSYNSSLPVTASATKDLAGFHWDMTKGTPAYNAVNVSFELTLNPTTEVLSAGDRLDVNLDFKGVKYTRFYGFIGTLNLLSEADSIKLSVFDNATSGQFSIDDAKIKIICGNSFGAELKAGFKQLAGYTPGNAPVDVTGLPASFPIPIPNETNINVMQFDSVMLDKTNSNIVGIVNGKPKKVIYDVYADLNPNGRLQRNILTDESQFKCIVDVELPMYGTAKDFVLESVDSAHFDLEDTYDDMLENVLFRFTGVNGYPIGLETQLYLINAGGQVFDSLFTDRSYKFLEAAPVGADGKVVSTTGKTTDVVFDLLRAKRLRDLKRIKTRVNIGTLSQGGTYPSVKLYSNYVLRISVGVKAKLNLNLKAE